MQLLRDRNMGSYNLSAFLNYFLKQSLSSWHRDLCEIFSIEKLFFEAFRIGFAELNIVEITVI